MAAQTRKPSDTEQPTPAATVRTQEYTDIGWNVGQRAPKDAFRALDTADMATPVGPVLHTHPGGYARQVVAAGGLVTEGVKREIDGAKDEG